MTTHIIDICSLMSRGSSNDKVEAYIYAGMYVISEKDDSIANRSMVFGEYVYGEDQVTVETNAPLDANLDKDKADKTERLVCSSEKEDRISIPSPFRPNLSTRIIGGIQKCWIVPYVKVLYLGGVSATYGSHMFDVIVQSGTMYAMEF